MGYCVGKTKCSSGSLRKCYGKGEKGRGWGWGQTQEHRESSGKEFLVIPASGSEPVKTVWLLGVALALQLGWVKLGFSASFLTLAALGSEKSVLRALLPTAAVSWCPLD